MVLRGWGYSTARAARHSCGAGGCQVGDEPQTDGGHMGCDRRGLFDCCPDCSCRFDARRVGDAYAAAWLHPVLHGRRAPRGRRVVTGSHPSAQLLRPRLQHVRAVHRSSLANIGSPRSYVCGSPSRFARGIRVRRRGAVQRTPKSTCSTDDLTFLVRQSTDAMNSESSANFRALAARLLMEQPHVQFVSP